MLPLHCTALVCLILCYWNFYISRLLNFDPRKTSNNFVEANRDPLNNKELGGKKTTGNKEETEPKPTSGRLVTTENMSKSGHSDKTIDMTNYLPSLQIAGVD